MNIKKQLKIQNSYQVLVKCILFEGAIRNNQYIVKLF